MTDCPEDTAAAAPMPLPVTSDERLLLDVIDALRGADNLRDRLLAALQSGAPAVSDLAYAVKARVKEDLKAVDKIKDRRRGGQGREPQPAYGVSNLTDLVGVRIVTLYRLDALDVIDALLATVNGNPSPSAPFVAGSISEVTIYSTNPKGDVQKLPDRLKQLFRNHGLGGVTEIEEKPSNYSSIHILVRGRGKYGDGYREVPVEIQVRTALEDVWGQIEHSLKYKRAGIQGVAEVSSADQRLATTLSHLGALKTMIDGIAQYGDQIKLQIDELEPELRYSSSRSAEEPKVGLARIRGLPAEIRADVAAAFAEAQPGLNDQKLPPGTRIRQLRAALSRYETIADRESALPGLSQKARKELHYFIGMQRALIHFQLGNLLDNGEAQLNLALRLYGEMERTFPARPIVAFRYARTLDALGARDDALAKMRDVVRRLDNKGEPTPKNHWIRSAAPRGLGVLLWGAAVARSGKDAVTSGDGVALDLLREAYQITAQAHDAKVFEDASQPAGGSERSKAANNLLYYLLDYLEAGGEPQPGMERADVGRLLDEVGGRDIAAITKLSLADTVRRAHAYLGDKPLRDAAAHRVLALSGDRAHRSPVVRNAIRAAERTIDGDPPVPPSDENGGENP